MEIVDVRIDLVAVPAEVPYSWRQGLPGAEPSVTGGWLRVVTDDGLIGLAYTQRGVIVKDLVDRRLRTELLGADPLRREYLWHRMWEIDRIEEMPIYALGLVDVALWDLAAKAAGLPLHRFLGGYRDRIPAYASTVTFSSTDEYIDVADQCLGLGYKAIKLHAWGDARRDAALAMHIREHVGADISLMYDGSAAFDLPDAVYLGNALADAGYLWYEEPMREFSLSAYASLAKQVRVPLNVAETSDGAHMNTADFLAGGYAQYVRTDPRLKAGVTGCLRVAHVADAVRVRAEVHGGGLVNAHLCMAIPNTTYYESLVRANPVARENLVTRDGYVEAPDQIGIGFEGQGASATAYA